MTRFSVTILKHFKKADLPCVCCTGSSEWNVTKLTTLQIAVRRAECTYRRWKINRLHERSAPSKLNHCRVGYRRLKTALTIHFSKNCYENNRLMSFYRFFTTKYDCQTARFPSLINRCILFNGFGSPIDLNVKPMFVRP